MQQDNPKPKNIEHQMILINFDLSGQNIQAKSLYALSVARASTAFQNWRNTQLLTLKSEPSPVSPATNPSPAPITSRCTREFTPGRGLTSVPNVRGLSLIVLH